ncbi:hypothetical protein AOQ84DRAFT_223677 [Glonium stellatum]|uniref:Uncharacterized protein n=1 Tax=Glonium stellatum TaxID=574774 RepID=A0A8E2JYA3_9PEZI|nr:hypothetical protein AOQ84DRAFT_223677 [Glonium stellatum]
MIITSRYVYKKYKKRKQAKEQALANDSANHDQVVQSTMNEIANAPAEQLCADTGSPSDPPPGYSSLDKASHPYQTSNLGLSENTAFWPHPNHPQISAFPSASQSPMSPIPMSPAGLAQQQLTEIEVRGKWVWVPETSPASNVSETKSQYNPDDPSLLSVELPACSTPKEMAVTPTLPDEDNDLDDIPELDGTLVMDKQKAN